MHITPNDIDALELVGMALAIGIGVGVALYIGVIRYVEAQHQRWEARRRLDETVHMMSYGEPIADERKNRYTKDQTKDAP